MNDLPARTQTVLDELATFVRLRGSAWFRRRDAREALGISHTQIKVHLRRLVDAELVTVHRAANRVLYSLTDDEGSGEGPGRPNAGRSPAGQRNRRKRQAARALR